MTNLNDMDINMHKKILDSLPVGIYLCNTKGELTYINDAYAEILGLSKDKILNRNIVDVIPKTRALKVMESGNTEIGDICVIGEGQDKKTTIVNRVPMTDQNGTVVGMVSMCMFRNPDELKSLVEKMNNLDSAVSFYKRRMQSALSPRYTLDSILGESTPLTLAKNRLVNYAKTEFPVLIQGPTGTGKELFANALHASSPRREGPFVGINCAAVPIELFESELFGYVGGAFSGASKEGKVGLIELADKGTLFLDEIGDMPMAAQAKLLRVLEEKTVYRVGSTKPHAVDFRLVAATNRDLSEIVGQGAFREDLFYRISALPLQIPSLAERAFDIPVIARAILERMGKDDMIIAPETMQALIAYDWPGNIRELRNALIRAVSVCDGYRILPQDLPPSITTAHPQPKPEPSGAKSAEPSGPPEPARPSPVQAPPSLHAMNADAEIRLILQAIEANSGNMVKTAQYLNISRATLYEKCRKHGITRTSGTERTTK
jgi:PAS domain S-box-containing protein